MSSADYLRSLGYRLYRMPTGCYDVWTGEGGASRMLGNWSAEEVEAEAKRLMARAKDTLRVRLAKENVLRDGSPWSEGVEWDDHDWREGNDDRGVPRCFVDGGPSPAGNPGPYLKVPYYPDGLPHDGLYDTRHRVYPRWGHGGLPRRKGVSSWTIGGDAKGWFWVVEA